MKNSLIKIPQPKNPLPFTGARYTSAVAGQIEHEHLHRYLFALDFCHGAAALDVASGEGYGTSLIGLVAKTALGVDNDQPTIDHASRCYATQTVSFKLGSATQLPVEDSSQDTVVSFETLEHLEDHQAFLSEIKRVLKPDGLLLMSTPEIESYNKAGGEPNPFHVKELTRDQFKALLRGYFRHVQLYGQRPICGSCLVPVEPAAADEQRFYDRVALDSYAASEGFPAPIYFIAVASNRELPKPQYSLLHDNIHASNLAQKLNRPRSSSSARRGKVKRMWRRIFGSAGKTTKPA